MFFDCTDRFLNSLKRGRVAILFLFFMLTVVLGGCTTSSMPDLTQMPLPDHVPQKHKIDAVPVIAQDDHYCGPAAFSTLAQYSGADISQEAAAEMVYTPGRKGTFQHDMVSAMQRSGFVSIPVNSLPDMFTEISSDHPVIIFQNLGLSWYPVWHYSVISGYDIPAEKLRVHGGTKEAKWKDMPTVWATWKRAQFWGYVAVPPGEIPPTASENELLQATAGLERARNIKEAEQSYNAVLNAYPQSYGALFGLGNIAMTNEQFAKAEDFYRRALDIKPDHVYSLNNLAYALQAQDKNTQACRLLKGNMPEDVSMRGYADLQDSYQDICK